MAEARPIFDSAVVVSFLIVFGPHARSRHRVAELDLEQPLQTAALWTLAGVTTVVMNQWCNSFQANADFVERFFVAASAKEVSESPQKSWGHRRRKLLHYSGLHLSLGLHLSHCCGCRERSGEHWPK